MRKRYINKMINLDTETADLADKKPNFSAWVRGQLRSERNRSENTDSILANNTRKIEELTKLSSRELLWQLEQRTEAEIAALVSLLQS